MLSLFVLKMRRPPSSTLTDTLFPDTTLSRSVVAAFVLQPVRREVLEIPERMTVSLTEDVGLSSTAPAPVDEARAALAPALGAQPPAAAPQPTRSEEHTSELQSLMRTSYAVFCSTKQRTTTLH